MVSIMNLLNIMNRVDFFIIYSSGIFLLSIVVISLLASCWRGGEESTE
jgi:hypothetical protein